MNCPAIAECLATRISPRSDFFSTCGLFLRRGMVMYISFPKKKVYGYELVFELRDDFTLQDSFSSLQDSFCLLFDYCPAESRKTRKYDFSWEIHFDRIIIMDALHDIIMFLDKSMSSSRRKKYGFGHSEISVLQSCPTMSPRCPADFATQTQSDEIGNATNAISWTSRYA